MDLQDLTREQLIYEIAFYKDIVEEFPPGWKTTWYGAAYECPGIKSKPRGEIKRGQIRWEARWVSNPTTTYLDSFLFAIEAQAAIEAYASTQPLEY